MSQLEKVLLDEVAKSMPSMVGDQLKARLIQADNDAATAARVPSLTAKITELEAALAKVVGELTSARAQAPFLDAKAGALMTKEQGLELREAVLKAKEEAAGQQVSNMMLTLDKIFRERSVITTVTGSQPVGMPTGGYVTQAPFSQTLVATDK
jgi:glycine cleavage system aminomethyltransferase T